MQNQFSGIHRRIGHGAELAEQSRPAIHHDQRAVNQQRGGRAGQLPERHGLYRFRPGEGQQRVYRTAWRQYECALGSRHGGRFVLRRWRVAKHHCRTRGKDVTKTESNATTAPPKPIWCRVEDGHGEAGFDLDELKSYLTATTDEFWTVRDDAGNFVGVSSVSLMRRAYLA